MSNGPGRRGFETVKDMLKARSEAILVAVWKSEPGTRDQIRFQEQHNHYSETDAEFLERAHDSTTEGLSTRQLVEDKFFKAVEASLGQLEVSRRHFESVKEEVMAQSDAIVDKTKKTSDDTRRQLELRKREHEADAK
ncbi:hypothetical protein PSPO01_06746 [Paraphaeosphaeria sporulosa]